MNSSYHSIRGGDLNGIKYIRDNAKKPEIGESERTNDVSIANTSVENFRLNDNSIIIMSNIKKANKNSLQKFLG